MSTQYDGDSRQSNRRSRLGKRGRKWLVRLVGAALILTVGLSAGLTSGAAKPKNYANNGDDDQPRGPRKKPRRLPPQNPYPNIPASPIPAPDPGEEDEEPAPLDSLKKVAVPGPTPSELDAFIVDRAAALRLGKALFWDTRVGSDNRTACASCHFSAGVDTRIKNQLSPGLTAGDKTFQLGGPNYTLKPEDFPFTRFADINNVRTRYADVNDIASSQGVFAAVFGDTSSNGAKDTCTSVSDAVGHGGLGFNLNGVNTRRVEPRHTPGIINSVFNFRNFWDGRGNNVFNGGDPFGLRNPDPQVWKIEYGVLRQVKIALPTSTLASVAVAPPRNVLEMSCMNRTFAAVGRKLVAVPVLSDQTISASDSVLGSLANNRPSYGALIRQAFRPEFWASRTPVIVPAVSEPMQNPVVEPPAGGGARPRQFAQIEANFGLFFGLAVQMYMRTLISDDTPFDRFKEGNTYALTAQQKRGMAIFTGPVANCIHCHAGPVMTSASFVNVKSEGRLDSREGLNNTVFRYDNGFFNTGVRPTREDPGVGGLDTLGNPLSETRMSQQGKTALLGNNFNQAVQEEMVAPGALTAVDGAFKTPGLRNVEFTAPYFHNGGKATLMQVVDFYNRGGDFGAENQPITDPAVRQLGLTEREKQDLVAFLLSLSDDRVRFQRAPFDHPSICLPIGLGGDDKRLEVSASGHKFERFHCTLAIGANGSRSPLGTFLNLNPFQH